MKLNFRQLWGFICILVFIDQASFGKGSISLIILFKEKTWLFQKGENDILCLIAAILGNTYGCLNTSIFTYTLARKNLLINRLYPWHSPSWREILRNTIIIHTETDKTEIDAIDPVKQPFFV